MAKKINCRLSEQSFEKAAQEVEKYKKEINRKCELLASRLAMQGYTVTNMIVSSISPVYKGSDINVFVTSSKTTDGYSAQIVMNGSQSIFIEFGAGIVLNGPSGTSLHPKGQELGFTINSYNPNGKANIKGWPGSNATNPSGWRYKHKSWNQWMHTLGTPTYMPLEKGIEAMTADLNKIAREVFGSGR